MKFLKNTALFLLILGLIVFTAYKGLQSLEQTKAEDQIRAEKLSKGECEFNTLPLDDLLIQGYAQPLKLKMNLDSLKYVDPANEDISYEPYGQSVYMSVVKLNHTSPIKFLSSETVVLDPSWRLPEFAKQYPLSYACREGADGPLTQYGLQIDNSNASSPIECIRIFFTVAERVGNVEIGFKQVAP